jgi:hypothetical protein
MRLNNYLARSPPTIPTMIPVPGATAPCLAPSLRARSGSSCTSINTASTPTATAALALDLAQTGAVHRICCPVHRAFAHYGWHQTPLDSQILAFAAAIESPPPAYCSQTKYHARLIKYYGTATFQLGHHILHVPGSQKLPFLDVDCLARCCCCH